MTAKNYCSGFLSLAAILWVATASASQVLSDPIIRSLAEIQSAVEEHGDAVRSFQIEAVVCAVVRERRVLVLQDQTSALMVKLLVINDVITSGDRVTLRGTNCLIARDRYGIQISNVVVDNDRRHPSVRKAGNVYLEAGLEPIFLEWFNGPADSVLKLEYEGPGIPRQNIPASILWRKAIGTVPSYEPGLDFDAYKGDWDMLPDFTNLNPVTKGMATNFSVAYSVQREYSGLVFKGFIQIQNPGTYTFYLTSDDGARLEVGHSLFSCSVEAGVGRVVPVRMTIDQAQMEQKRSCWVELNGEVAFAGTDQGNLQMDILEPENGHHVQVTVMEGAPLLATNLLHFRVRVSGIGEFSRREGDHKFARLIVPELAQMQIYPAETESGPDILTNHLLTTAAQVRRLKPEEVRLGIPVEITGVVIAASPISLVLQDASGGVFVTYSAPDSFGQPELGQAWKIIGTTGEGNFAPLIRAVKGRFLGNAAMPEPFRPTPDQLMKGNLDAEYVEIHGVVASLSESEMNLLTPEGKVTIRGNNERPLPQVPSAALTGGSLVGNLVRMRGCFTANYNLTEQGIGGVFNLYPAVVEVEEPMLRDSFSLPTDKASDLLHFDAGANFLQRVKLAGQLIHMGVDECFLLDGQTGVRVLLSEAEELRVGDMIEAVGFPKLDSSGLVLQVARVRPTSHVPLPKAVKVSSADLLNVKHNATLVEIQALVISDARQLDQRVLELQSESHHFLATLKEQGESAAPVLPRSFVQLTGVYNSRAGLANDNPEPFELLLNSDADILVLQQPPWWTLRGALIMAAFLAIGLGTTMIWIMQLRRKVEERTAQLQMEIEERQLIEQHRLMEMERTRVAQDLHDELGVGLTQVGLLGSLAKNPALSMERKNIYLDQLSDSARTLVAGLDGIVWAINPKYDSVHSLASYFALFAQRLLNLAAISCRFENAENAPDLPLESKLRHGIFLAFKEALNNVVKHSGATKVRISFTVDRNRLVIVVMDNGCGFADCVIGPGSDGVKGMRQRMETLGGQCVITSQLEQGTTVIISLPITKDKA